ncbi:hypothetical protein BJX76DRAFT_347206 [Aspergillus varians]
MTGIVLDMGRGRAVKKPNKTLENEIQVFKRLDSHKGIIPCFRASQCGIERALEQGDLEALSHIHSCNVFVDDIVLRNILILDEQPKIADFGQSILLPPDIDIAPANENDMTNPGLRWPKPNSFPNIDDVLCGNIINQEVLA